jgi:hypothetical protein
MRMRIKLAESIGENCLAVDHGKKLNDLILPVLRRGDPVELDFSGVKTMLTPFLHTGLGKLLDFYEKEYLMRNLSFCNITAEQLQTVNAYLDRADRADTDKSHREAMQELFGEDSIDDDG